MSKIVPGSKEFYQDICNKIAATLVGYHVGLYSADECLDRVADIYGEANKARDNHAAAQDAQPASSDASVGVAGIGQDGSPSGTGQPGVEAQAN